jgi:chemotaxis protein MotB
MKQGNVSQKALGISGVILAILVLVGWYLYGAQQSRLQTLADESQAKEQILREALDQSHSELDLINQRIRKLTENLSAVQDSLTDEQRLRIELQADLAQTHTDKKQIEQSMQDTVQAITATTSELEMELQRQLLLQEKLNSEIGQVSDEKGELLARLENEQVNQLRLQQQIDLVSDERSELLDRIENEQENQFRLQQQIDRVKDDVGQKETALANSEQEAERLNMQLSQTREERVQLENKVETLNQQREIDARHFAELEDRLKRELNESRIEISQFKNQMTVIKLTSEVLFNSGSANIQLSGQKVLAVIAESLSAYPNRAISIEGHTDNVPIGKRSSFSTNWELSTARALAAVNFFQQANQMDPQRLQVVGHGEFQPVSSNETVEGRQQNRRIEIRLMPEPQVSAEQ